MDNVHALLREIQSEQPTNVHQVSGSTSRNGAMSPATSFGDEHRSPTDGRLLTIGQPVFPKALGTTMQDLYLHDHWEEHLDDYDLASLANPPFEGVFDRRKHIQDHAQQPLATSRRIDGVSSERQLTLDFPFRQLQHEQLRDGNAHPLSSQADHTLYAYNALPPGGDANSSPLTQVASSPSFQISKRRALHDSHVEDRNQRQGRTIPLQPHSFAPNSAVPQHKQINLGHAPPMAQGIQLVSLGQLPDRFRSVFPYPLLNAVQSKCFPIVYTSNDNLVLSAPTGSGKTVILELAICRLVNTLNSSQYKIVYMAPTKSLCSERQKDWQAKFASLNLSCAELTGDTDQGQLRNVQNASIIITTPEKWDSMTRKLKDQLKLVQMVKLFLIDEVHILKETRGATLEAVVSRMKSVGTYVRFLAISATVPNSEDIATWLGKNPSTQHLPAQHERFGEEFRPVKLQKFVYGLQGNMNDFAFDKVCDAKLPDLIAKHSLKKPIMIFCFTRTSCVVTAKLLANIWAVRRPQDRRWMGPTQKLVVIDSDLKNTLQSGVAFHHAGLDGADRIVVEKGFLDGQVNVICCTSTLAVGVNLPCHLVIVKNTVSYQETGIKEYTDLEMMQMLGRAGRPQFEDSAIAIIVTKQEKAKKYEKMIAGEELLESWRVSISKYRSLTIADHVSLHLNLIDHLNAEICLGTVFDIQSAKRWLAGTFLCVRLRKNPAYYKFDKDTKGQSLEGCIETICQKDLDLLQATDLVNTDSKLKCTAFGEAMARYYVKFETMRCLLMLQPRSKMSEILSALVEAQELREVRFRASEKKLYQEINKANGIKYPIKVDIALSAHKRTLIIQAELGAVEYPAEEQYQHGKRQFQMDKAILFSHIHRLIRCVIDCQLHLQDAVSTRHALELARSFSAKVWDNSPLQLKQIPQIGPAAVRKLAVAGINSIEALELTESHRIDMIMSKHPPFGRRILDSLLSFPKLWVTITMMGKEVKQGKSVKIKVKAECGFLNDQVPTYFRRNQVYVCFLAERSDGYLVDFRRVSARNLGKGQNILLTADITDHLQYITCYVMCDGIAGTLRHAQLKPGLSASLFPHPPPRLQHEEHVDESSRRSNQGGMRSISKIRPDIEGFSDEDIDDQDMVEALEAADFRHIDDCNGSRVSHSKKSTSNIAVEEPTTARPEPQKLENGKWECSHKCKDKATCKHLCCREGVNKVRAPRVPKPSGTSCDHVRKAHPKPERVVTAVVPSVVERLQSKSHVEDKRTTGVRIVDLSSSKYREEYLKKGPKAIRDLDKLHEKVCKNTPTPNIPRVKPISSHGKGGPLQISFLHKATDDNAIIKESSDYDDAWMEDLPSPTSLLKEDTNSATYLGQEVGNTPAAYHPDWKPFRLEPEFHEAEEVHMPIYTTVANNLTPTKQDIRHSGEAGDPGDYANMVSEPLDVLDFLGHVPVRKEERIFLSTDSPEKFLYSPPKPGKRQADDIINTHEWSQSYTVPSKKRRSSATVPEAPVNKESQNLEPQANTVLAPWEDMEGIDMDLLAEFAGIVNFV